jgi:hypothetical protein
MSCMLLHPSHHSALAGAWFAFSERHSRPSFPNRFGIKTPSEGDVARILAGENGRAYHDRYEYDSSDSKRLRSSADAEALINNRDADQWAYNIASGKVSVTQVLKWLHCYEYQTSDSKTYEGSPAQWVVEQIAKAATRKLEGYDSATWTCEGFIPSRTEARKEGDTKHFCQDC